LQMACGTTVGDDETTALFDHFLVMRERFVHI
jgi:hypothetical protein